MKSPYNLVLAFLYLAGAAFASAQTAEIVDEFTLGPKGPAAPPTLAPDGSVYGTTLAGGAYGFGAVYKISPEGQIIHVASFTGNAGTLPGDVASSAMILAGDGNLYGVTERGGTEGAGTVFKVVPGGQVTTIASFTWDRGAVPGAQPQRSLAIGAQGHLYGTTRLGGSASVGTVFQVSIPSGVVTHLTSFTGGSGAVPGFNPVSTLALARDGHMYGAAETSDGLGMIFKVSPSGTVTTVARFTGHEGNLQGIGRFTVDRFTADGRGNLYGVSRQGGPNGFGTVFKLVPGGETKSIATFTGTGGALPGANPYLSAYLTLAKDGFLYGTTQTGGSSNAGVIYRVRPEDDSAQVVASFTNTGGALPGRTPMSSLTEGGDGSLYGTLRDALGGGAVYRITPQGSATILGNLTGPGGALPGNNLELPLVAWSNGDLVGVTSSGGRPNNGAAFFVRMESGLASIGAFEDAKGSAPRFALTAANDGVLYGTTPEGGESGKGLIFSVRPNGGGILPVASFTGTGGALPGEKPWARLTLGDNGRLYGTTLTGGTISSSGTVFRVTPEVGAELLAQFGSGVLRGRTPLAALVRGPDGNLFGTAEPETGGRGAFFRVPLSGQVSSLSGTYSAAAQSPLELAGDSKFYGVSQAGGTGFGTVFVVDPADDSARELAIFTGVSGALPGKVPRSKLTLGKDGALYGTTSSGGADDLGTVFRVMPGGAVASIASFAGNLGSLPGAAPYSALVAAHDGNLYGVTRLGGINSFGGVFRVIPGASARVEWVASFTGSGGSLPGMTPTGDLVAGLDGNLFGTTEAGGANGLGTIFKIVLGGTVTSLASFTGDAGLLPGAKPLAPLALAADGNLYGTSSSSGTGGGGTLFRVVFGPTMTTQVVREVSFTTAALHSSLNPNNEVTEVWFEYGVSDSLGSSTPIQIVDSDAGFSQVFTNLTQLLPGATYYYRVVGRNATGIQRGITRSFQTKIAAAPTSQTVNADRIGVREARLLGSVTANGLQAAAYFQLEAGEGNSRSTSVQLFEPEDREKPLGIVVSGLLPHTRYEYRAVATSPMGTGVGETLSFTTANTLPVGADKNVHSPAVGVNAVVYGAGDGSDADGDALTVAVESYEGSGSVSSNGSEIIYTSGGFVGSEKLEVRISDAFGGSALATVTLHNAAPVAGADSFRVGSAGAALDVLSNDTDADQDLLMIAGVSGAAGGTLTHDGQKVTYTPGSGFRGFDQFTYTVSDQHGGSAVGYVTVMADYSVGQTLAMKNEEVPGGEGSVWTRFGVPSIFEQGTEAGWLATIKSGNKRERGIFSGPIGAPALRVRAGDRARDVLGQAIGGSQFRNFKEPVFAGRSFAFVATVSGPGITPAEDTGMWIGNDDSLRAIGREGSNAPGTNGAKFQAFTSVAMPGSDAVFFTAKLKTGSGGVNKGNNLGLWVWTPGGSRLVLRKGQGVDFGSGALRVQEFKVLSTVPGSAGHGRYDAHEQSVDVLVTFSDGAMAVIRSGADAVLTLVALTGQTDESGRRPIRIGPPSSPGKGEDPVALVTFQQGKAGVTKKDNVAVWDFAEKRMLAQSGAPAPGISGGSFKSFLDPVAGYGLEGQRVTAFLATVSGVTKAEDTGVWVHHAGGTSSLQLLGQEGSEPPGAPGTRWKKFESVSIIEGRGAAFTAKLGSGSTPVSAGNDRGLWVTDTSGVVQLLLREGDQIGGQTLRSFSLLQTVPGSPDQRRSWTNNDPAATLIYLAHFSDGSSGVFTLSVP